MPKDIGHLFISKSLSCGLHVSPTSPFLRYLFTLKSEKEAESTSELPSNDSLATNHQQQGLGSHMETQIQLLEPSPAAFPCAH